MQADFSQDSVKIIQNFDFLIHRIDQLSPDKIFLLMDANTEKHCYPEMAEVFSKYAVVSMAVQAGERSKILSVAESIWKQMLHHQCTRNTLLINLGGGVITDLGGFVASTYKRGMPFMNIPTSLMAQVDAAIGGKNGVNFLNFKNQIGTINQPDQVLIYPAFLKTLDTTEFLTGFAEILKYACISSKFDLNKLLNFDLLEHDGDEMPALVSGAVEIKNYYVQRDPLEHNIRKALNFGHTFAHAFESFYAQKGKELSHGYAVAAGLICELYLSVLHYGFSMDILEKFKAYIIKFYGRLQLTKGDLNTVIEAMKHDKKNVADQIIFTLVNSHREAMINKSCSLAEIREAFEYYLI